MYRKDRDCNGGGVAMYVRESLPEPTIKLTSDKLELIALLSLSAGIAHQLPVLMTLHLKILGKS